MARSQSDIDPRNSQLYQRNNTNCTAATAILAWITWYWHNIQESAAAAASGW
jgi:hypothetical protein